MPPEVFDPVVVANGTLDLDVTDLESDGFGTPWGITRSWTNNPAFAANDNIGNGWLVDQEAQLIDVNGDRSTLKVILDGTSSVAFSNSGTPTSPSYFPWYNAHDSLSYNSTSDLYVFTDSSGDQSTFYGFGSPTYSLYAGTLDTYQPASGSLISVTSHNSTTGAITEEERSGTANGVTTNEYLLFNYISSGDNAGQLGSIALNRSSGGGSEYMVRQVVYSYYDTPVEGVNSYGLLNDLETATVEDSFNHPLSEDYYRYDITDYSNGSAPMSELEYEFNNQDFARALENIPSGYTIFNAPSGSISAFATLYVAYGDQTYVTTGVPSGGTPEGYSVPFYRVTSEQAAGVGATDGEGGGDGSGDGTGDYSYSYYTDVSADTTQTFDPESGTDTTGFNTVFGTTTVVNPDHLNCTYLTNFAGQIIGERDEDENTGITRFTVNEYDGSGDLVMAAMPSALPNGWGSDGGLITPLLSPDVGEVDLYTYYAGGTSTAGATSAGTAVGYLENEQVQAGSDTSSTVLTESFDYKSWAAGSAVIYYVADDTVYQSTGGGGAETTGYQYTYASGTFSAVSLVTTLPIVTALNDGPGTATTDSEYFDPDGNVEWEKDPDGDITFTWTDVVTGGVLQQISDVNTSTSDSLALTTVGVTSPFTLYAGDGLSVINTFNLDPEGRVTGAQDGDGNWTYTVYDDVDHETLVYPGWHYDASAGYYTTAGPVEVEHDDWSDGYVYTFGYAYQPSAAGQTTVGSSVVPTGDDSNGLVTGLTREELDNGGQLTESDAFVGLSGVTFNASNATLYLDMDVDYDSTSYAYDLGGNLDRVQTADGTIQRKVYDQFNEPVSTWIGAVVGGTPDDGYPSAWSYSDPGPMVQVSAMSYDADGNETEMVQYPNGTGSNGSASMMYYDFRDRLTEELDGAVDTGTLGSAVGDPTDNATSLTVYTLDNLGEATETKSYAWNTASTDSFSTLGTPIVADFLLTADSTAAYDSQGDVYESVDKSVSPTTFATDGPTQTTYDYYDADENLIAELDPDGTATKYVYNGAGWNTFSYVTDGGQLNNASNLSQGSTNAYIAAATITNDVVLSQQQNVFDNAGNVIETISADRFGNDPATGSSAVGGLGTPTTGVEARVSYTDGFYDNANRDVADVNVGTFNGSAYTRPSADAVSTATAVSSSVVNLSTGSTVPSGTTGDQLLILNGTGSGERATVTGYSSGTFTLSVNAADWGVLPDASSTFVLIDPGSQVSQTSYTPAGDVSQTIDPKGIATGFNYDALGETLNEVDDDTAWGQLNLSASVPTDSSNQTTAYTWDRDGNELTMTADMPSGETSQITHYVYGVNTGSGSSGGSLIDDNDLLAQVQYPDPTSGTNTSSGTYNQPEFFKYNAVGQQIAYTDRNLTTHNYTYDPAFRLTLDSVSFASGDPASNGVTGLAYAYNPAGLMSAATSLNSSGGTLNQVGMSYNGFGDLTGDAQAHSGTAGTGTPTVGYTYNSSFGDRLTGISYPDGRTVSYNYATGLSTAISQLSSISDSGGVIQSYSNYLGLGVAGVTTDGNGVTLSYMNTAAGSSALNASNGGGGDEYAGLGRFGWVVDQNWGTGTSTFTSVDRVQSGYDADGNVTWQNNLVHSNQSEIFTNDNLNRLTGYNRGSIRVTGNVGTLSGTNIASGSWTLNAVGGWNSSSSNGVTTTRNNSANNQIYNVGSATLHYDKSGDTTTDQNGATYIYDGWHRLTEVVGANGTVLANYSYDAEGRQITQADSGSPSTDLYYDGDSVVEERQGSNVTTQEVWSPFDANRLVERDTNPLVTTNQSNGSVDTTFGTNTTTDITTGSINTSGGTLVADGSDVLLIGVNNSSHSPYLAWYTSTGTLDTSYGGGTGMVAESGTGWTGWSGIYNSVVLPDGDIAIGFSNTAGVMSVAELTAAGSPNTSFGTGGVKQNNFSSTSVSLAVALDGDLLVAGATSSNLIVEAINPETGSPDASFGSSGIFSHAFTGFTNFMLAGIAVQPGGRIIVAGEISRTTSPRNATELVGLTKSGTIDATFGTSGTLTDYTRLVQYLGAFTVDSDGRLYIGSLDPIYNSSSGTGFYVERFTPEGAVDTSFGTNGVGGVAISGEYEMLPLAIEPNDQMIVGGAGYPNGSSGATFALARFNDDGTLDTSFGSSGVERGASDDLRIGMAMTSQGKTVLAATNTSGDVELQQFDTLSAPQRLYAETDADDNVTSITNSSGAVVERYSYDPYGVVTVLNADFSIRGDGTAASSDYGWVYLHQGMRFDVVMGMYDNNARIYDPALGDFLQQDPDGYIAGPNTYAYELDNPDSSIDPTGNQPVPEVPVEDSRDDTTDGEDGKNEEENTAKENIKRMLREQEELDHEEEIAPALNVLKDLVRQNARLKGLPEPDGSGYWPSDMKTIDEDAHNLMKENQELLQAKLNAMGNGQSHCQPLRKTAPEAAENAAVRPSLGDNIVDEANRVAAPGGEITDAQRTALRQNLPVVQRRSAAANQVLRAEFEKNQQFLISEWERNTGRTWPAGATPHHILPLESGGANAWWNLMPTYGELPNHALPGIPGPHAAGGVLRQSIQQGRRALPPGTTTDLRTPQ